MSKSEETPKCPDLEYIVDLTSDSIENLQNKCGFRLTDIDQLKKLLEGQDSILIEVPNFSIINDSRSDWEHVTRYFVFILGYSGLYLFYDYYGEDEND